MPTSTVENYLKQIFLAQQQTPDELVSLGSLATAMQVVPGTVTTMVKNLAESGLAVYEPRQGVRLTKSGDKLACAVLRRHRLIELFLVKVLHLDWSEVHVEAEELEHSISDRLLERIDTYLGQPEFDPHGDPIPSSSGHIQRLKLRPLTECLASETVKLASVSDQDGEFLKYAQGLGLVPGVEFKILQVDAIGESVTLRIENKKEMTLGSSAASKFFVHA